MKVKLDLRLFFIESLATNKKIEKDIAKLYEKYKYKAYKLAKNSELYNHPMICDGNIWKEIAGKRVLGLLLLSDINEDVSKELMQIIKKGWLKLYNFLINKKEISLKKVYEIFFNKSITDDEINAILVITLLICNIYNIKIRQDETYNFCITTLQRRLIHYKENSNIERFCYNNLSKELRQKAKSIKNRFFENYGIIKTTQNIYDIKDELLYNYIDKLSMIFDTENMMFLSMTGNAKVSNKDLEEIAALYYMLYRNQNKEKSAKFIITGLMIKYLIKAYKEVKEYYFQNNKETLYIELEELENQIKYLKNENSKVKRENKNLKNEIKYLRNKYKVGLEKKIIELEKQITEQQKVIEGLKENEKELYALRELAFELEHDYQITEKGTEISNVPVLIVGGHENWRRKLNEVLPSNFRFLDGTVEGFDIRILDSIEYVFFYTAYMNHAVYYKIINYCKKNNVKIKYIKSTSIDLVLNEIKQKLL